MPEPSPPRIYIQTADNASIPYFRGPPIAAGGRAGLYVLEHLSVEAGSLAAHTFDADVLMLPLGSRTVRFHSRLNGRRVTGLIAPQHFRFLARGDTLSTCWSAPLQGLFLALTPALMIEALGDVIDGRSMELVSNILPHEDPILCHLLRSIGIYVAGPRVGGRLFEQSLLAATAIHVLTRYSSGRRAHGSTRSLPRWKLMRLAEYIRAHLGRELHLKELAAVVGLSPYHLARAYKAATGHSLWQDVIEARVRQARRLILAHADLPLAVIAKDCGFDSYCQFIAAFRKFYSLLPSEYRNSLRPGRVPPPAGAPQ